MGNGSTKKPFYRNTEDTLEDVKITRRQLGYWRKEGLFAPELGPRAKFFTRADTEQLRFLKQLIEGLGLPIATVKRLIDSVDESELLLETVKDMTFIDIYKSSLVSPHDAMSVLIVEAIAGSSRPTVDHWFMVLALQKFIAMALSSATPEVYEAQKKAFFDRFERLDLLARLTKDHDGEYVFRPARDNDPLLSNDLFDQLVKEKELFEAEVDKARMRQIMKEVSGA
jgi:DNA-binding transcriptional MerR regulator